MKTTIRSLCVMAAVGAFGFAGCDAPPPPPSVVPTPVPPEAVPPGETLVDVVQVSLGDIVRDRDVYSRARRLGALLPTLGPDVIPAVKQTLESPTADLRAPEIELLLTFWAGYQPEEATRWAKIKAPTRYREAAIYSALKVWAEADPQAAVSGTWNWVEDPLLEGIVPIALVHGWYARNDPPQPLRQFLRERPPGVPGQRAIASYIRILIQTQGAEAAMRWAESLPDDEDGFKLTVFRRTTAAVAELDVVAAMEWCKAHCDGAYGKNMRSLISRGWAFRDAPPAFAWLATTPEGHERDLAVRVTFVQWVELDPESALAWMADQLKDGPVEWLEPAYYVYAMKLSGKAPAEAIEWASRIKDPQDRERMQIGVARVWRSIDEGAAQQWLLKSPLTEEARNQVQAPLD